MIQKSEIVQIAIRFEGDPILYPVVRMIPPDDPDLDEIIYGVQSKSGHIYWTTVGKYAKLVLIREVS